MKRPFLVLAILDFSFQNKSFCIIPLKRDQSTARIGQIFYVHRGLKTKTTPAQKYATQCTCMFLQSYEIKSPPWTIWLFRILGIFSVENINRMGAMMFQSSVNNQLCIDSKYSSQQLTIACKL